MGVCTTKSRHPWVKYTRLVAVNICWIQMSSRNWLIKKGTASSVSNAPRRITNARFMLCFMGRTNSNTYSKETWRTVCVMVFDSYPTTIQDYLTIGYVNSCCLNLKVVVITTTPCLLGVIVNLQSTSTVLLDSIVTTTLTLNTPGTHYKAVGFSMYVKLNKCYKQNILLPICRLYIL